MSEIQVLVLGDTFAGKTSFIFQLKSSEDSPLPEYQSSFGISNTPVQLQDNSLRVYEIGGNSDVKSVAEQIISNIHGAIIIVDVLNEKGTCNLDNYLNICGKIPKVVVANKIDCSPNEYKIDTEKLEKQIQSKNIHFYALSAKNKDKVDQVVSDLVGMILNPEQSQKQVPSNADQANPNQANPDQANADQANADQSSEKKPASKCCILL